MKRNRSGVITVEAALIMPVVIGVLALLYTLAIIQYENVVARAQAMRVANRAAFNWNTIGGADSNILTEDMKKNIYYGSTESGTGKTGKNAIVSANFESHDPYRFFVELFTTGSQKKANMRTYLDYQMNNIKNLETGIAYTSSSEITSDSALHIFNRYVSVEIKNSYNSPVFTLLARMGYPQEKDYSVIAKAKLTEPADFVRNISYIQELIRKAKSE